MPALIFDCDGVLADTERDGHRPAFNQTFADVGLPVRWSEEEYAGLHAAMNDRDEDLVVDPESFALATYSPAYVPLLGARTALPTRSELAEFLSTQRSPRSPR